MSRRLRLGVVGAGWWSGVAHLPAIDAHPDATLVAVCDTDLTRAKKAAEEFRPQLVTDDLEAMTDADLDAVIIATPQGSHHDVAARFLNRGIDTLVEKPLTVEPAQAWDLVRHAERSGARLHVGHTFPHSRSVQAVRDAVVAGELGTLTLASALFATSVAELYRGDTSYARQDTGATVGPLPSTYSDPTAGGQLYSQLTHALAVVLFVTDAAARDVVAVEDRAGMDVDLSDAIACRLTTGGVASFASTGAIHPNERRREGYLFAGSAAHATLDTVAGVGRIAPNDGEVRAIDSSPTDVGLSRAPALNLTDAKLGRAPVVVPGELGARVVDAAAAARAAARRLMYPGGQP